MNPTFNAGQSVCSGCGFEFMSCGRLSLLMNVTREPAVIVTLLGETPAEVIVIVAPTVPPLPLLPPPPVDGLVGLSLPPQDETRTASAHAPANAEKRVEVIGRISSRC